MKFTQLVEDAKTQNARFSIRVSEQCWEMARGGSPNSVSKRPSSRGFGLRHVLPPPTPSALPLDGLIRANRLADYRESLDWRE